MWFSMILFVLLLGIAFYQVIQGLLSGLIMMVLTICCVAASLSTYEFVAVNWIAPHLNHDYAIAVAIAVTFGVPLAVLRCLFDSLIRRACLLPSLVDRSGAAVCGIVTAYLIVGMVALSLPNLPFQNGAVLDFARFDRADYISSDTSRDSEPTDLSKPERNLWLNPDRFACSVGSWLSNGLFSGSRDFAEDNPDLVQAIGWRNAVPSEATRYAPPDAITVVAVEKIPEVYKHKPAYRRGTESFESVPPEGGMELWMIRVKLNSSASPPGGKPLFTMRQFRLVGWDDEFSGTTQYHAIALQEKFEGETPPAGLSRHVKYEVNYGKDFPLVDRLYLPRKGSNNTVEVVFELPKGFKPWFLEFRYGARAAVSFESGSAGEADQEERTDSVTRGNSSSGSSDTTTDARSSTRGEFVPSTGRKGRVKVAAARQGLSKFGNRLPEPLTNYRERTNTEIKTNGALVDGHLVAYLDDQSGGRNREVKTFDVPEDKRLLQLNVGTLRAKSTYGKALSYAKRIVQNFLVSDANGRQYQLVGKVAIAEVGGRRVMEVQYFSHQMGTIGGVGQYEIIRENHLEDPDAEQFLLFLVEPGARIITFSTGGSSARQDDLTGENLVAPK